MGSLKADRLNASRLHLDWGPIDIRKGFIGLAAAAQQHQRRDACSGVALAFCRRRGIFEQGLGLYPSRLLKRGESQGGEALDVSQNIKDLARGSGPKGSGSLQRSYSADASVEYWVSTSCYSLDFTSASASTPASAKSIGSFGLQSRSEEHTSELPSLMRISYA